MRANSRLNEETMRSFLEPQGEVEDITEKVLAEEEAERQRVAEIDEKLGEGSSIIEMPGVGDGSLLAMTDGNRTAVFVGKTGGSYEDATLKEKCYAAAKEEAQELDARDAAAGDPSFSLQEAKALLLQKLSFLGIEDIHLARAYSCEADGFLYYDIYFSPVVDKISIAYSFGSEDITRVYPDGHAFVCAEGVADIGLWNFCMEQASAAGQDKVIGWDKVQELLEAYLADGSLQCVEEVPFSTAELVYYVELKDGELELSPAWSIHMDLEEYVEYTGRSGRNDFVWNIYIDAESGELIEAQ